jgi:hypothetical protein
MRAIVRAAGPWEYFCRKVQIGHPSDCWEWRASCGTPGYGNWCFGKMQAAHRAAYKLFKGKPQGLVLHRCGNRKCCNPDHLYDGTYTDNRRDSEAHGTAPIGSRHGQAKLTENQVLEIRRDKRKRKEIAAAYGISPTSVTYIKQGATWGWL